MRSGHARGALITLPTTDIVHIFKAELEDQSQGPYSCSAYFLMVKEHRKPIRRGYLGQFGEHRHTARYSYNRDIRKPHNASGRSKFLEVIALAHFRGRLNADFDYGAL